jgi:hypothetical protein
MQLCEEAVITNEPRYFYKSHVATSNHCSHLACVLIFSTIFVLLLSGVHNSLEFILE